MRISATDAAAALGATAAREPQRVAAPPVPALAADDAWRSTPIPARLQVLRRARHDIALHAQQFAAAISPLLARTAADTLVCEVLPLLDAIRFLERNAASLLRPRRLGARGRPLAFSGIVAEVQRDPLGHVLIIGPSNFPLFLPGVQAVQALAAGNRVTWKPGAGGGPVALLLAETLRRAGLPAGVLRVTGDDIAAAESALAERPDKVVFTGSAAAGKAVLHELANTATPAVMELSGCDAVLVLPGADLDEVAQAIAFGLRLNGGAVCMSPRRVIADAATLAALRPRLRQQLDTLPAVKLGERAALALREAIEDARAAGAEIHGTLDADAQRPMVVDHAHPHMAIAGSDLFAPVVTLLEAPGVDALPRLVNQCDFALTCAIFCARSDTAAARTIANKLRAGVVLINDIIAPTADPRLPFGGRGASGFGVTRGAEGLLDMTTPKVLITRRRGRQRHFDPTSAADAPLFAGMIRAIHAPSWASRFAGVRALLQAARRRQHTQEKTCG